MEGGNNKQDQKDEIEALQSIYLDEFSLITEDPYTFEIKIDANRDDDSKNHLSVIARIEFTENYPAEYPKFHIKSNSSTIKGNEIMVMEEMFHEMFEKNLGMPMIYEAIEEIRGSIQDRNDKLEGVEEDKRKNEESKKDVVKVFEKKFVFESRTDYTPVNPETFNKWLQGFVAEMTEKKKQDQSANDGDVRLSGKELFLKRKDLFKDNFDEDGEDVEFEKEERKVDEQFYFDQELYNNEELPEDVDLE